MSQFSSTKRVFGDVLKDVSKIQLPEFQRGWVWDDGTFAARLASLARSPWRPSCCLKLGAKRAFRSGR